MHAENIDKTIVDDTRNGMFFFPSTTKRPSVRLSTGPMSLNRVEADYARPITCCEGETMTTTIVELQRQENKRHGAHWFYWKKINK